MPAAPRSEEELLARAEALAGLPVGRLATDLGIAVPDEMRRAKGLVGRLMEEALGATAGTASVPDFAELGIELKTIPLDAAGKPKESTFVCSIPLPEVADTDWEQSAVCRKLARVLWVPVEGERERPLALRRVGAPFLWSPSDRQLAVLRGDWELFSMLIARGEVERITGHFGEALQVRPKAADSRARRLAPDHEGVPSWTLPRGFYLRTRFTESIVAHALLR